MRKHRNREKILLKNSLSLDYSLKHIEDARIKINDTFAESSKEEKYEESACAVLAFTMIMFLVNCLFLIARQPSCPK
jgi:hypothetical protein